MVVLLRVARGARHTAAAAWGWTGIRSKLEFGSWIATNRPKPGRIRKAFGATKWWRNCLFSTQNQRECRYELQGRDQTQKCAQGIRRLLSASVATRCSHSGARA